MKLFKSVKRRVSSALAMVSHNPCHMTIVANVQAEPVKQDR